MFWADKVVDEIEKDLKETIASGKELVVRDEKTASGHPHIGSMVGVALHDTITRVLKQRGIKAKFYYEINDTDPMDGMPAYLDASIYEEHMGKPLCKIPAPDNSAENLSDYFGNDFIEVIKESGYTPEFYKTSELYNSGRMNEVIKTALENAEKIREIYKNVSGSEKGDTWLPISIICENCGKVGTTKASEFDGELVTYNCYETAVKWAKGCNHAGKVSPFNGNATLPWKVEWAAKFKVMGVNIEGAGKDHSTKGGSRDVARKIAEEIFDYKNPFDVPYEFFLVGGKKMSSSKGNASTAREISDMLPGHILRLALVGREINRQTNFDPQGDSIPMLFDRYDRIAEKYWDKSTDDDSRVFELVHADIQTELLQKRFLPRFSQIAFLVQMPHLDIYEEVERMKESPLSSEDRQEIDLRAKYAKKWLENYAPEQFRFEIQQTIPTSAKDFSDIQKSALTELLEYVQQTPELDGKALHEKLHEIKTSQNIQPKELFSAIYQLFLGRTSGPQVGWFLSTLDKSFVATRLEEAVK
jgi:lysyl-tRNA synthetase class 1